MFSPYRKFEFYFPVTRVYLFKNFLSFSVTGSQLSQCFAVRTSVVFLAKTKTQLSAGKFKFAVC
jgi:hypothetical protein